MASESKGKEDFSPLIESESKKALDLAADGNVLEACNLLLLAEKKTRLAGDSIATAEICSKIVGVCIDAKDYKNLKSHLTIISKRRGQHKAPITRIVQDTFKCLEGIEDKETLVGVINTLRTISEGKIYVEVERARLTRMLSKTLEDEGKIAEASAMLQEVQVETYGSMDKFEKADFILEQVRLCIAEKDWVRARIISKKANKTVLTEEGFQACKVRYYKLLITIDQHDKDPRALFEDYRAIFGSKESQEDPAAWIPALELAVTFLVLAKWEPEVADIRLKLGTESKLDELPLFKTLLTHFNTHEIIKWPLTEEAALREHAVFTGENGEHWWGLMRTRVIEHNIRTIGKYYTRIRFARMCSLLGVSSEEVEESLSRMVVEKMMYARINRPEGIVNFVKPVTPAETLSEWAGSVSELLSLVENTTHLINKEVMVHKMGK